MKKLIFLIGGLMVVLSFFMLEKDKITKDEAIQERNQEVVERIACAKETEVIPEVLGEKIPVYPGLKEYQKTEDILSYPSVGYIEIPSVDVSVCVRYGTSLKENLDDAACIAEFSKNEKLFILGHNYEKSSRENKVFHNLLGVEEGDVVELTLINNIGKEETTSTFRYKVVFSKRYSEEEFYQDDAKILMENPDFSEEFNLCLITCNNDKQGRGRQVVYCQLQK